MIGKEDSEKIADIFKKGIIVFNQQREDALMGDDPCPYTAKVARYCIQTLEAVYSDIKSSTENHLRDNILKMKVHNDTKK